MDYQKHIEIAKDLLALAKKHNIMIMVGGKQDPQLTYNFDGFGIFITDGTPSKRKQLDDAIGKAISYESSVVLTLKKIDIKKDENKTNL